MKAGYATTYTYAGAKATATNVINAYGAINAMDTIIKMTIKDVYTP